MHRNFPIIVGASLGAAVLLAIRFPVSNPPSSSSDHHEKSEIAALKNLPSLEQAQASKVLYLRQFLSKKEISALLKTIDKIETDCGKSKRDKNGLKKYKADDAPWRTTYLHTDHLLQKESPKLIEKIISGVKAIDKDNWKLLHKKDGLAIRTIEIHEAFKDGGLSQSNHFDGGSLITLDIMLSPTEDFTGGDFMTMEKDGNFKRHTFEEGDCLVFQSHKYHTIDTIRSGHRKVFVMELWQGEERSCPHRCCKRYGECAHSLLDNAVDFFTASLADDI